MGILTAPFWGFIMIAEEIAQLADEELYGGESIMEELTEIYKALEDGSLSEEAFEQREAQLVQRLAEIDERKLRRASGAR
jgi:CBS domain containing-hemolysin-like protein